MSDYKENAKVPYVSREDFPQDQIGIYDHILQTRKLDYIPELFARMGSSPGAMEAVASVGEHVRFHSVLDDVLREMVICTVSQEVGNWYEWCHHIHRMPADMQAVCGTPAAEDLPAPIGPALKFARITATSNTVDDGLIEAVRDSLGDQGVVDLTVMVGYYQLVGTFCNILQVPIEDNMNRVPMKK